MSLAIFKRLAVVGAREVVLRDQRRRIDRLITDISNASRLDAELSRAKAEPLDLVALLKDMADLYEELRRDEEPRVPMNVTDADLERIRDAQPAHVRQRRVP